MLEENISLGYLTVWHQYSPLFQQGVSNELRGKTVQRKGMRIIMGSEKQIIVKK